MARRGPFATGFAAMAALLAASAMGCAPTGSPEKVWGIFGSKDGWIKKPRVATFDAEDNLFIADLTDRIQVFDRDGGFVRAWRMPAFNVDGPSGLTVDRLGRLLIADTHFYRVLICDREGNILRTLGTGVQGTEPGVFCYPTDVVIDSRGNFYVSEYGENDRIQAFSPEGEWLRQWGGHGFEPGQLLRPRAMAIDENDRIYVADSCNHRVQVFDTMGNLLRIIGKGEGKGTGELLYPYDVSLAPDGTLYVCEYGNHRVQRFTREGEPLGIWGAPGRKHGELNNPWALAVDSRGAVSVIDTNNHRVQRFRM